MNRVLNLLLGDLPCRDKVCVLHLTCLPNGRPGQGSGVKGRKGEQRGNLSGVNRPQREREGRREGGEYEGRKAQREEGRKYEKKEGRKGRRT